MVTSTPDERRNTEKTVIDLIQQGIPCSLINMEDQLILGWNDHLLITAKPWKENTTYPPGSLTFQTWEELGDSIHISFYSFQKRKPEPVSQLIRASLAVAVDMWNHPDVYAWEQYGVGPKGYEYWLDAIKWNKSDPHGSWWNAMVWSECRNMAAAYIKEIRPIWDRSKRKVLNQLIDFYNNIAVTLRMVGNKDLNVDMRLQLLAKALSSEQEAIPILQSLLHSLKDD
jgi:hypothetical protein